LIIPALISLATGLGLGHLWSTRQAPQLGNFHLSSEITPYRTIEESSEILPDQNQRGGKSSNRSGHNDQASKIPSSIPFLYQTIGNDGKLTWGIRDLAGIDDSTAEAIQHAIDSAMEEYRDMVAANAYPLPFDHGTDITASYQLKAFPETGEKIWQDLVEKMNRIAGKQSAAFLIAAFHPDQRFGGLGKYDYKIEFRQNEDHSGTVADITGTQPGTEIRMYYTSCNLANSPLWIKRLNTTVDQKQ
jgi:hypothetical protein